MNLDALHRTVAECRNCKFTEYWKFTPSMQGNFLSKIMVVGESAFQPSIQNGKYYSAGNFRMILRDVIELEDCYLTDLLKCAKEFSPTGKWCKQSAERCSQFLFKEIELIKPIVIIAVGKSSFQYLTKEYSNYRSRQGDGYKYFYKGIRVMSIIHPSSQNRHYGKATWQQQIKYNDSVRSIFDEALKMVTTIT